MINERVSTAFQVKYILSVWAITTLVFAMWWQVNPPVMGSFLEGMTGLLGTFIPFMGAGLVITFLVREGEKPTQITDKSIGIAKIAYSSKKLETHAAYYPAAAVSVTPIFSVFAIFNRVVAACVVPFAIMMMLMTFNPLTVVVLVAVSMALSWIVFALINLAAMMKIKRYKTTNHRSMRTVNTDYSQNMVAALCRTQAKTNFVGDWSDRKDIMMALAVQATETAFLANDLIVEGVIDPDMFESEIKTIEHTLNAFIPNTISATNDFFKANKKNGLAADRVYEAELAPKIIKEANKLNATNEKTAERLVVAYEKAEAEYKKNQEALVDVDKVLLTLSEGAGIPVPAFPEFTELKFSNDQKRVAAKNIVAHSLKTLIDAKNKVTSGDDKQKLERQINKVKDFVKSLASNTPESADREARLRAAIKDDPLFLGTGITDIDDVDNTIAINERYIDSYDRSLPISKK